MNLAITAAIIAVSAVISAILTKIELPVLQRLKAGQAIREEGPQAHLAKAGTPTMGGISMIITLVIGGIVCCFVLKGSAKTVLTILLVTVCYAAIGFKDDYIKVTKHHNEGLTSKQKLLLQVVIGLVFGLIRFFLFDHTVFIPFVNRAVSFGIWIIPFTVFVFVAMTNAVNLTDGLDGLASSVTMNASLFIGILCMLGIRHVENGITTGFSGNAYSAVMAFVLCGACAGFLVFNHHPARLFMGDTGSLALGACLSAIAMTSYFDFALPIVGLVYVVEALSVIIQVVVFKTQNGRRFFRMAPIHHHFELGGWSEEKVDTVFSVVTLAAGVLAILIFR